MSRLAFVLLPALLSLTACQGIEFTGQTRADAATQAACREHADQVYDRTHREQIYSINNVNTPYSTNYTPGRVDSGLSQQYGRDSMVRDCIRNTGTETDRMAPGSAQAGAIQTGATQPPQPQSGLAQPGSPHTALPPPPHTGP